MRTIIALAATLTINFAALSALHFSAQLAQAAPAGQVLVTQLPDPQTAYAQLSPQGTRSVGTL